MAIMRWCFFIVLFACFACQSTELSPSVPLEQSSPHSPSPKKPLQTLPDQDQDTLYSPFDSMGVRIKAREMLVLMTERSATSLSIAWEPLPEAESYQVLLDDKPVAETKETQFTFSNLQPDTRYLIRLKAQRMLQNKHFEIAIGDVMSLNTGAQQTIPEAYQKQLRSLTRIGLESAYGNIYDDQHQPVSGAQVTCFSLNSMLQDLMLTTFTDHKGFYRFEQLPAGVLLKFVVSKNGYNSPYTVEVLKSNYSYPERNRYDFGTKDDDGHYSSEYSALSLKPEITEVLPAASAIARDFYLRLKFSHSVIRESVTQNLQLKSLGQTPEQIFNLEDFEVEWGADSTDVTFKPPASIRARLVPGDYQVTFDKGDQQLLAFSGTFRDERVFRSSQSFYHHKRFTIELPPDVLLTEKQPRLLKLEATPAQNAVDPELVIKMSFSQGMSRKSVETNFQMLLFRDLSKEECSVLPPEERVVEGSHFATADDFDISWHDNDREAIFRWKPQRHLVLSDGGRYRYEVNLERNDAMIYSHEGFATDQKRLKKSSLYITEASFVTQRENDVTGIISLDSLPESDGQMHFLLQFSGPIAKVGPEGLTFDRCASSPLLPDNYSVSIEGLNGLPLPGWEEQKWSDLGGTVSFYPHDPYYRTLVLTVPFQEALRTKNSYAYRIGLNISKKIKDAEGNALYGYSTIVRDYQCPRLCLGS